MRILETKKFLGKIILLMSEVGRVVVITCRLINYYGLDPLEHGRITSWEKELRIW